MGLLVDPKLFWNPKLNQKFWRPDFVYVGGHGRDLISNTLLNQMSSGASVVPTPYGPGIGFSGVASSHLTWLLSPVKYQATELTYLFVTVPDAPSGNDVLFHNGISTTNFDHGVTVWSDNLGYASGRPNCWAVRLQGATHETAANSIVPGELNVLLFTWKSSGTIDVWTNGVHSSGWTAGVNPSMLSTVGNAGGMRIGGTNVQQDFKGKLLAFAVSRKALPSIEFGDYLAKNPFSIFDDRRHLELYEPVANASSPQLLMGAFAA